MSISPNNTMNSFTSSPLSPYYYLIFTALAFISSTLILIISNTQKSKKLNLPPGPPGWPVVGNALQVALSGKPLFEYLRDHLIPKYGPILTLKMGTRTLIVISNANLVHEALIEKGQIFSSRPRETPTRTIFSSDKITVNAAVYGPVWRSTRRNMVQNSLSPSKLGEFSSAREITMDRLIHKIKTEAEQNDGAVWVVKNVRFAFFYLLCSMCFGVEMDEELIEKIDEMMKNVLLAIIPRIDDYLPILSPFFSKEWKRIMELRRQQIETLMPLIEKRRKDKSSSSFSYLDTLFDLQIEGRKSALTNIEIVTLCSEFLNGGTDTTATAMEWAIARVIENPDIQQRLYEEIKRTVGNMKVDEKHIENMPYLNAVVKELLRKHPPSYFSLTHAAIEPAKLGGYDIPVDANLEIFLPGISDDPTLWSDPEKFDPDRFFMGREEADITGRKGVKMIPFGMGRRICPGLQIATTHVSLMLARMVQEFEWSVYPENSKLDFSEKLDFTIAMKDTLRAKIKTRV